MKTKIFAYALLIIVYLFPFRYAYLTLTGPDVTSLLSMVATVFGTLIFILLTFSDKKPAKEYEKPASTKQVIQ